MNQATIHIKTYGPLEITELRFMMYLTSSMSRRGRMSYPHPSLHLHLCCKKGTFARMCSCTSPLGQQEAHDRGFHHYHYLFHVPGRCGMVATDCRARARPRLRIASCPVPFPLPLHIQPQFGFQLQSMRFSAPSQTWSSRPLH